VRCAGELTHRALVPVAAADLQGWNGAGYVTGGAPITTNSPAAPAYTLFNGGMPLERMYAGLLFSPFSDWGLPIAGYQTR